MRVITSFLFSCLFSFVAVAGVGTVFLEGQPVLVPKPDGAVLDSGTWKALDDQLACVASGAWSATDAHIEIGALPIGWYRIEFLDSTDTLQAFTTAAVLKPLAAVPSPDSPVAVDIALSWVPDKNPEVWAQSVELARMAGVAMVRDRLRWRDLQPEKDAPLLQDTVYEQTADLQRDHGLQVLQVFHDSPQWAWANDNGRGRMPADLRDTWRFCRDIAAHFKGRVQAWQPWNEGNVRNFGGHTMDELCSHQKAACLGFRAGDPKALVCWAPMAGVHTDGHYKAITANAVVPYFDVFTFHSYDWCHSYPELRKWVVQAASEKSIWVTESDRGIKADPDSPVGDLTHHMERLKAEFMIQSIVSSLATGVERHFHFILPQYMEQNNAIQFGLLRHDNTPRMGYVTLAAAGRFLVDARYLGRAGDPAQPDVYVFAFRARPDGVERDVLVAWTEASVDWPERGRATAALTLEPALHPVGVWDYMGRALATALPSQLTSAPVFIVLPAGEASALSLQTLPPRTPGPVAPASPVVLQLFAPDMPLRERTRDWSYEQDRTLHPGDSEVAIVAYYFGNETAEGTIKLQDLPEGWQCDPDRWDVTLKPLDRHEQTVRLHIPESSIPEPDGQWLHFEGDFGAAGKQQLAFRIMLE